LKISEGPYSVAISNLEDNRLKAQALQADEMPYITICPNPTHDHINISANTEISVIEVSNLIGNVLCTLKPLDSITTLDLTNYAPGVYFLKIQFNNNTDMVTKVIKE
jgi:hypothetical protein